ncbi:hypothetical protein RhiXN_07740 [Rhizoctonia solani]|uniref:Uncharacterized protein n=1 Tax=Rhizoctonia solani TaxID=456999 RepID=A0A8H8SYQ1_9AGAM|nr:uncharacterized protein RhiXN_07740 [Rhizoctonia solani]QRW22704.1 hypothetical protein RhiXN_07740 [Rhizoctonia solani]
MVIYRSSSAAPRYFLGFQSEIVKDAALTGQRLWDYSMIRFLPDRYRDLSAMLLPNRGSPHPRENFGVLPQPGHPLSRSSPTEQGVPDLEPSTSINSHEALHAVIKKNFLRATPVVPHPKVASA